MYKPSFPRIEPPHPHITYEGENMSILEYNIPSEKAVAEAERCRREARAAIDRDPGRYAELKDQPSGWCVVTQKRFLPRVYDNCYGVPSLGDCFDRGHKLLLTLGFVANPDSPLSPSTHVASVEIAELGRISDFKLELISARAKLHAARALL